MAYVLHFQEVEIAVLPHFTNGLGIFAISVERVVAGIIELFLVAPGGFSGPAFTLVPIASPIFFSVIGEHCYISLVEQVSHKRCRVEKLIFVKIQIIAYLPICPSHADCSLDVFSIQEILRLAEIVAELRYAWQANIELVEFTFFAVWPNNFCGQMVFAEF